MFIVRFAAVLGVVFALGACDDDPMATPDPTSFTVRVENVSIAYDFVDAGVFNTPVGAGAPGPLMPGQSYAFEFGAAPGHTLHFATMFVQSNDFFYGPDGDGIALHDGSGNPLSGDITDQVLLWDAGTEINQEPGLGPDQAPMQPGPNTGAADPNNTVRAAPDDFGNLPSVDDVVQVTLTSLGEGRFRVEILNVSEVGTLMTSDNGMHAVLLAPGVFVVGDVTDALFVAGQAEPGDGLEALAEDGDPSGLSAWAETMRGLTSPLAPGAWAVHTVDGPLFTSGTSDRGDGLEALAEDGDPSALAGALASMAGVASAGAFNTPVGAGSPGPLLPGEAYEFTIQAIPGDRLSFATMLVQSNDLFYAPAEAGIALFQGETPVSGDVTSSTLFWDAGTEVNQQPGVGPDQAPRQGGPDTGADEAGTVRQVDDGFAYPDVAAVLRVTITPSS